MRRLLFILPSVVALLVALVMITSAITKKTFNSDAKPWVVTKVSAAAEPNTITIDYAKNIATGSPLVFGGSHTPASNDINGWNIINEAGVTMIRRDFWIENYLPKNITLENYKNNDGNIQDIANWNWYAINDTNKIYKNSHDRGMKVIAILSFIPGWLGYDGEKSVPRDWNVYEDLVKKTYKIHRQYIDFIEIWNEPDKKGFLSLTGSGMNSRQAYEEIFMHASKAIRQVDSEINDNKKASILGPVTANFQNTQILQQLLASPASQELAGISLHTYSNSPPTLFTYQNIMKSSSISLPIFITEWNQSSEYKNNPYNYSNLAIAFTAKRLINFLGQGITGANYYSTTYFEKNSTNENENVFGFYQTVNGKTELLPQGKTWQLLSKSLNLGGGYSRIHSVSQPSYAESLGFTNYQLENGLAVVNDSDTDRKVQINLTNLLVKNRTTIKLYIASATEDAKTPVCTQDLTSDRLNPNFWINLPPQSVTGIILTPPKLSFNSLLRVLGISTTSDCLIGL